MGVVAMSMRPEKHQRIPVRTVRTARAVYPSGTVAMLITERLDVLSEDEEFAGLYPADGRLTGAAGAGAGAAARGEPVRPGCGRRGADQDRLEVHVGPGLGDPGFDYTVLCEFRAWPAENGAADQLLEAMLQRVTEAGLLKAGADNVRAPPMHCPRCASSAARSWSGRRCCPLWRNWMRPYPTG